MKELAD